MSHPRDFHCNTCGSPPGEPCLTADGRPTGNHVSRIEAENREWLREHPVPVEEST